MTSRLPLPAALLAVTHVALEAQQIPPDTLTTVYMTDAIGSGRAGYAMQLFQMNAESFPGNANAQFHYGESLRYTGQLEGAAAQYRRALELQPDHAAAAAGLAEVTGGS